MHDDGTYPYSPACLCNILRPGKNGRYYIITNINPEPGENCDPRTTLQIAGIDIGRMCIIKSSVTPIETRTGDQPPTIRCSNFRWYEDRKTRDIILFLTACPGDVGRSETCGRPPQSFRYAIRWPDEPRRWPRLARRRCKMRPTLAVTLTHPVGPSCHLTGSTRTCGALTSHG